MRRRPSGGRWRDPVKSQRRQIEFIDKDVDHLNGIVLVNPVSKALGKQRSLTTICTFNKAPRPIPPQSTSRITARESHEAARFYTTRVKRVGLPISATSPLVPQLQTSSRRLRMSRRAMCGHRVIAVG